MKSILQARSESTCQKRITVCVLLDATNTVLACESNRCAPTGGSCHRLGLSQTKAEYPSESECNWTHAERMAIAALAPDAKPVRAVLYGHDFYCDDCERALRAAGVTTLEVRAFSQRAVQKLSSSGVSSPELLAVIKRESTGKTLVVSHSANVGGASTESDSRASEGASLTQEGTAPVGVPDVE